jgi:hypothetical protein
MRASCLQIAIAQAWVVSRPNPGKFLRPSGLSNGGEARRGGHSMGESTSKSVPKASIGRVFETLFARSVLLHLANLPIYG